MPNYLRAWPPGGTFFFTVNLLQRQGNDLLIRHIDVLRRVVMDVKRRHPFVIHAWVVLPEHLHCVIELPSDDADFALRWRLIKMDFSKPGRVGTVCPRVSWICAHTAWAHRAHPTNYATAYPGYS